MNPTDILVLMAENVSEDEGINLICWWLNGSYKAHIMEDSMQWFIAKHAMRIAVAASAKDRTTWTQLTGVRKNSEWL